MSFPQSPANRFSPAPPPQTKATPDHQRPSGGGQSLPRGGGGSSRRPTPAPVYTSDLLKQSFTSDVARKAAEQSYVREQQAAQAQQQQASQTEFVRQQTIRDQQEKIRQQNLQGTVVREQPKYNFAEDKTIDKPVAVFEKPTGGVIPSYKKRVGDKEVVYYTPVQGTAITDPMGNMQGPFIETKGTPLELDYQKDIEKGLLPELAGKSSRLKAEVLTSDAILKVQDKYQSKVDKGELSVEEAQVQANAAFEKEMKQNVKLIGTDTESKYYETIEAKRIRVATGIGKSVLSMNPLGATVLGAEALQRNQLLVLEEDGTLPLYPETRQTSKEAAIYFGAATLGALKVPFKAAEAYDKATLEALKSTPIDFVGTEKLSKGGDSVVKVVGKRSVVGAKETISAELKGFGSLDDPTKFSIQGSRATSAVEFNPLLNTLRGIKDPILTTETVKLFGKGQTLPSFLRQGDKVIPIDQLTTKGDYGIIRDGLRIDKLSIKPAKLSKFSKLFGPQGGRNIYTSPKITIKGERIPDSIEWGRFGGQSIKQGDLTVVAGGDITKVRLYPFRSSEVVSLGQRGVIKSLGVEAIDDVIGGGLSTVKKGTAPTITESLQTFGQAVLPKITSVSATPTIGLNLPVIRTPNKVETELKVETKTNQIQLIQPTTKVDTTTATRSLTSLRTSSATRQRSKQESKAIASLDFAQVSKVDQTTRQSSIQVQRLAQKQQQALRTPTVTPLGFGMATPRFATPKVGVGGFGFKMPKATFKQPKGLFAVEVRRGGVFRNIGTTRDLKSAFALGQSKVGRTLAATFRVKGLNTPLPKGSVPTNFYTKVDKKEGTLFIERRSKRLSTGSEIDEIISAKARKPKRKKK